MPSLSSQGLETAEMYCNTEVYDVKMLTDSNKTALLLWQVGNLIHELLLVGCKCLNLQLQPKGFIFAQRMLPTQTSLFTTLFKVYCTVSELQISYLWKYAVVDHQHKACMTAEPA